MRGVRLAVVGPVFLGIRWGGGEETPPPCQAAPGVPGHDPPRSKALWGDGWRAYDAMFRMYQWFHQVSEDRYVSHWTGALEQLLLSPPSSS